MFRHAVKVILSFSFKAGGDEAITLVQKRNPSVDANVLFIKVSKSINVSQKKKLAMLKKLWYIVVKAG
tara:strand:+ start:8882 stop:9085 length:204 start_codon:yes stop_codon:yes gene_type:complete